MYCYEYSALVDDPQGQGAINGAINWVQGYLSAVNLSAKPVAMPDYLRDRDTLRLSLKTRCLGLSPGPHKLGERSTIAEAAQQLSGLIETERTRGQRAP